MRAFRNLISATIGIGIIVGLLWYLDDSEKLTELRLLSNIDYVVSFILLIITWMISGLQLKVVLRHSEHINLSLFDVISLPLTQNFWGYIIPFQGSFIYGSVYLKSKYGINISRTFSAYLFITVCSLVVGALVGAIHSIFTNLYFLPIYVTIILLPVWIVLTNKAFRLVRTKSPLLTRIQNWTEVLLNTLTDMFQHYRFIARIMLLDAAYAITFALWSYFLSESLMLNIPFVIYLISAFFMKLTLITKLTPGNIGVIQLFIGGIVSWYGYSIDSGFLISTLQLGLLMTFSFPLAIIFTIVHLKYIADAFKQLWGYGKPITPNKY